MADKIMPLDQALEGYELFDNMKVQKGMSPMDRTAIGIDFPDRTSCVHDSTGRGVKTAYPDLPGHVKLRGN